MDDYIIISPGAPMNALYRILGLSDNNADEKINNCIKTLIGTLKKKNLDISSRYSNLLENLPDDKIQEKRIKIINKLINELILFYETKNNKSIFAGKNTRKQKAKKNKQKISDWDASKVDDKLISTYIWFVENVTRPEFTQKCSSNVKKELSNIVLNLLDIPEFRNQIFIDNNLGTGEDKPIANYVATLVNISNSNLFEFITNMNQDKYFKILKLLLENNNLSEKLFHENNVGKSGPIRLYITALNNSAALIVKKVVTQKQMSEESQEKTIKKNTNIDQPIQICNNNVRFLIQALYQFVTDQNLKRLIFNTNNNVDTDYHKDINMFWGVVKNVASNIIYLENSEISDLLNILNIVLEQCEDLCINQSCCDLLLHCFTDILSHGDVLTNSQKKILSTMINRELLGNTWIKKILQDTKSRKQYFTFLTNIIKNASDLIDSKFLINVMYNFSNDKNIQQMSGQNIDVKICLSMLEDAIEQYISIEDKDLNLTFEKIVCILNSIQSKDYKFKEQIFYENKIYEPINENARDKSIKEMFDNKIFKHKDSMVRLYTSMLKNISQLSNKANVDIENKVKFFNLMQDILIKKEYDDIRKMILNEKENGSQGSICNLIQVFYSLLSENNLKQLKTSDKESWIQLFLFFICDEELQYQIFQLGNDGKNGAIDFYFRTLCNILRLENTSFAIENKKAVAGLIQSLKSKFSKAKKDISKCAYYGEIKEVEKILDIQKTINNKEQKKLPFLKFAKDMFEPKNILNTSKSMHDLFLSDRKLKVSKSRNKPLPSIKNLESKANFMSKSGNSSNSSIKTLKTSKSTGNFLQIRKKSSNKPLTLNLSTFKSQTNKSQTNKANRNINSINISTAKKPKTTGKINIEKDYNS